MSRESVGHEVLAERIRQDEKWGEQNHPDILNFTPYYYLIGPADTLKATTDRRAKAGSMTFTDILLEEVAEAIDEAKAGNRDALRTELIQVAAVAVAWAEKIDRGH